jgi:hypothetical protein
LWIPRNPLAIAEGIVEADDAPSATCVRKPTPTSWTRVNAPSCAMARKWWRSSSNTLPCSSSAAAACPTCGDGSARGGRSLCALPFDGPARALAAHCPPLDIVSLAGMGIAGGADMAAFFNATRSAKAALHVGKRLLRHGETCCCTVAACSWSMATRWWRAAAQRP